MMLSNVVKLLMCNSVSARKESCVLANMIFRQSGTRIIINQSGCN